MQKRPETSKVVCCVPVCGICEWDRTAAKWQWMHRYYSVKPSLNPFQYSYQLWSRVEDAFAFCCTELIFTWSRQTASFHNDENPVTSLWPQEYGRSFSGWLEYQNTHSYTAGVWRAKFHKRFLKKSSFVMVGIQCVNVSWDSEIQKTLDSSEDSMIVAQSARQISAFSKLDWNVLWGSAIHGL